jgi:4-amino-4-deoxy-L-arabinose transferase-like glycosyltransferase
LRENLGRFTHLEFGPARGYFYYAGVLAGDFFPWSLLLAAAVVWWVKAGQSKSRKSDRRSLHLLFLWIALWIVVFSLSHNKQEYYILPVYPAAALVVAFFLQKVRARGYLVLAFGSLTMLLGVGLLLLGRSLFPDVPGLWLPLLLVLPFPILAFGGRWHAAILSLSLFYASAFWIYLDPLERYRPIRHFSQLILEREASRGGPYAVGYYRQASPSLVFYLKRPVLEPYDLPEAVQLLNRPDRLYLVIRDDEFDRLQLGTQVQLEILDARPQLATRGSVILEHLTSGELSPRGWTNTVLLITNFPTGTEE